MKKSIAIFSATTLILLVLIGFGLWVLIDRQNNKNSGVPNNTSTEQQAKTFTLNEVASHNSRTDCWTIISGQVYELTDFINRHLGGDEVLRACGTDATTLFTSRTTKDGQSIGSGTPHSQAAQEQLDQLKLGTLAK
jgi:cytochrome b involved in lipid metabolism